MSLPQEHVHDHDGLPPHTHDHDHPPMMDQPASTKMMFILGIFVGLAVCMIIALALGAWLVTSGELLALEARLGTVTTVPTANAATPTANPAAQQAGPLKAVGADEHALGPANAKVTVVEYSDFECPYCKTFVSEIHQLATDYPKDVRIIYRHYPLSFHANAEKEAEASECVAELGGNAAFWKFHDLVFARTTSNGNGFALSALGPLAKEVGVDETKFLSCLDSGKYAGKVAQEKQDGANAGVTGTPTVFINGVSIPGAVPYAQIKGVVDGALKK